MDTEILARIQFAFTVAFHYIYPPLSIGIGLIMVIFEGLYLKTGKKQYVLTQDELDDYSKDDIKKSFSQPEDEEE